MAQAGKNVEDFALCRCGMGDAVGGQQWKTQAARQFDGSLVAALFFDGKVALQFDVNIVMAKEFAEFLDNFACGFFPAGTECMRQRAFVAAGEADQSSTEVLQLAGLNRAFTFCCSEFHARNQAAKVFVSFRRSDQQ